MRAALSLINQVLDQVLEEEEGDFDIESRWALAWFEESGFDEGDYGVAETLSKAKNMSVQALVNAGILVSQGGKVRLLSPKDLLNEPKPEAGSPIFVWKMIHHLTFALEKGDLNAAAEIVAKLGSQVEAAREFAYRLYAICERNKWAAEGLKYNALVQSWPQIVKLARERSKPRAEQTTLF